MRPVGAGRGGVRGAGLALQPDPERFTLPRFLEDVVARHGDRTALVHRGRRIRYRELGEAVEGVAAALLDAGVVKGARVGLLLPNRPDFVVHFFAASAVGAVVVPVNTFARPAERDHILRHGDVSILLMTAGLAGRDYRRELLEAHPALRRAELAVSRERAAGRWEDGSVRMTTVSPGEAGARMSRWDGDARHRALHHRTQSPNP